MSFANSDDFGALLGRDLTVAEQIKADLLLDMASTMIRNETRQTFDAVTDDVVQLNGSWDPSLKLPQWPVVDVSAVTIDGFDLVKDAGWTWRGGQEILRWPKSAFSDPDVIIADLAEPLILNGPDFLGAGHWGGPHRRISVTYSHGWAIDDAPSGFPPLPGDIRTICLQLALESFAVPAGVGARTETLGDATLTTTYVPNAGRMILSEAMRTALAKYRL